MIKRYEGSNFVEAENIRRFDGSNWIDTETNMRWDGSNWVEFATKTLVFNVSILIPGTTVNLLSDNSFSYSFVGNAYDSIRLRIECKYNELNLSNGDTFSGYSSILYNGAHHGVWTSNGSRIENFYTAASARHASYLELNKETGFTYQYGDTYVSQYGSNPSICILEKAYTSTGTGVTGTIKIDYVKINGVKYRVKFVL